MLFPVKGSVCVAATVAVDDRLRHNYCAALSIRMAVCVFADIAALVARLASSADALPHGPASVLFDTSMKNFYGLYVFVCFFFQKCANILLTVLFMELTLTNLHFF